MIVGIAQLLRKLRRRHIGAVVSKKILENAERIRFADRDEPGDESDSGWVFFTGTGVGRLR